MIALLALLGAFIASGLLTGAVAFGIAAMLDGFGVRSTDGAAARLYLFAACLFAVLFATAAVWIV